MIVKIEEFKEQYLPDIRNVFMEKTQQYIIENINDITKSLKEQMKATIMVLGRLQQKIPNIVGEIQVSLLRTSIHMGQPKIAFSVYDAQGILGREMLTVKYDCVWLFQAWQQYFSDVQKKVEELYAEKYIRKAAITSMIMESATELTLMLYAVLKHTYREFDLFEGYEELLLTENFQLTVGSYRDMRILLYAKRPEVDIFFRDTRESLQFCQFEEKIYKKKIFNNLDLSKTKFINCQFRECEICQTNFQEAIFEDCTFFHCHIEESSFNEATFRSCSMSYNYGQNNVLEDVFGVNEEDGIFFTKTE